MRPSSLVWLAVGALNGSPVTALDFYVSPTGSDSNAGSSADASFRSLVHAQQAVRSQIATSMTSNITVHLAPGTYPLSATLSFTSQDSGRNGFTVNWSGPGAVMSGGIQVTGWTQGSNGVCKQQFVLIIPFLWLSQESLCSRQTDLRSKLLLNPLKWELHR